MSAQTDKLSAKTAAEKLAVAAKRHGSIRHHARQLAAAHYAEPAPTPPAPK